MPAGQHFDSPDLAARKAVAVQSALAALLLRSTALFTALQGDTPLLFDQAGGAGASPSLSRQRYLIYMCATTLDQFYSLHPAAARGDKRKDLLNDVRKGLVFSPDMPFPIVHMTKRVDTASLRQRLRSRRVSYPDWRSVHDPSGAEWVRGFEARMAVHRVDMAADLAHQAEWDRIEGLDEHPPPSYREEDINRPDGLELDPRRFVPAYLLEERRVRLGVLDDYGPEAAGDRGEDILPFGYGFDVAPAAVIFAGVTNAVFAADLAAEKAAGDFVVGPSSFVGAVAASASLMGKGVDSRTVAPLSVRAAMLRTDFTATSTRKWRGCSRTRRGGWCQSSTCGMRDASMAMPGSAAGTSLRS